MHFRLWLNQRRQDFHDGGRADTRSDGFGSSLSQHDLRDPLEVQGAGLAKREANDELL